MNGRKKQTILKKVAKSPWKTIERRWKNKKETWGRYTFFLISAGNEIIPPLFPCFNRHSNELQRSFEHPLLCTLQWNPLSPIYSTTPPPISLSKKLNQLEEMRTLFSKERERRIICLSENFNILHWKWKQYVMFPKKNKLSTMLPSCCQLLPELYYCCTISENEWVIFCCLSSASSSFLEKRFVYKDTQKGGRVVTTEGLPTTTVCWVKGTEYTMHRLREWMNFFFSLSLSSSTNGTLKKWGITTLPITF